MREQLQEWTGEVLRIVQIIHHSTNIAKQITTAIDTIVGAFKTGNKLLVCGNGGSSSDSAHLVAELMNRFTLKREFPLPAIDLSAMNSTITAIANDYSFDTIFAKQIKALGKAGDVLCAISTSGTSKNIQEAINQAVTNKMKIILLTGDKINDFWANPLVHQVRVPSIETPHIQEAHIMIIHFICQQIDEALGGNNE